MSVNTDPGVEGNGEAPVPGQRPPKVRSRPAGAKSLFDPAIMRRAVGDSFVKLDPRQMMRNPVMFIVEVGSVLTTILFFANRLTRRLNRV